MGRPLHQPDVVLPEVSKPELVAAHDDDRSDP